MSNRKELAAVHPSKIKTGAVKALLAALTLAVLCLAQSPPKKKASDFVTGECEIGTKYDAKGDCITNPAPAQKKTSGYIADPTRQTFWMKEELRRRAMKKDDCPIALTLHGITDDHERTIRCAAWETEQNACLSRPDATFEKCERKF
jgi:hypothetical protein